MNQEEFLTKEEDKEVKRTILFISILGIIVLLGAPITKFFFF